MIVESTPARIAPGGILRHRRPHRDAPRPFEPADHGLRPVQTGDSGQRSLVRGRYDDSLCLIDSH